MNYFFYKPIIGIWIAIFLLPSVSNAVTTRLKELADIQGVRDNELYGYGLVVGLGGTGDTERVFFTSQTISSMLGRLGIRVDAKQVHVRNVAAVMVTAKLPPFVRSGSRIDVQVASLGDARSLSGGMLLVTPLSGGDGMVHAVAQGAVQVGGYEARSGGSSLRKNQTTSGRIPQGALVEKPVIPQLKGPLLLGLRHPDFTTANRIAQAINQALGASSAQALDPAAVQITIPQTFQGNPVALIAQLEMLEVEADRRAKIVVSERTGTVVAGEGVRIRPVAVAHGGLQVAIAKTPVVSQPAALSQGQTSSGNVASIAAQETSRPAISLPATASVEDLVKALNLLGASPRDLVAILQAIQSAGALDADLEVL